MNTDWAINSIKLNRAIATLDKQVANKEIKSYSEADLKKLYLSYAGAVRE